MPQKLQKSQKLSFGMNTLIFILVLIMMGIYYAIGATILVYYSVFVSAVYIFNYFLIRRFRLIEVTWIIYTMLTLYMFICTICLGYNYGFQLYSMSTIPLIYHIRYIAKKEGSKDPKPNFWSVIIVVSCLSSSLYSVKYGPIYHVNGLPELTFLGLNMASVSFFLIFFSQQTMNLVVESKAKLEHQANYDALTQLPNRYSMTLSLKEAIALNSDAYVTWIAMLDIDNFKKINDQYGHATGDQALVKLAEILRNVCEGCNVSRWGGEEFLICGKSNKVSAKILDQLTKEVEHSTVQSPYGPVHFTISVGESELRPTDTIDSWIMKADKLLYQAKNNGKNQVVYQPDFRANYKRHQS